MTVIIENTAVDTKLNIAELTTASLTGTGVFDVLLQTLRLHLDREFTSGRITGTAYATVYSQALTSFLGQATAYCLSKAKLALELQQLEEQVTILQLQQAKLTAETSLVGSQQSQVEAETDKVLYETTYVLPEEVKLSQFNQDQVVAQTTKIAVDTVAVSKQSNLTDAQTCEVRARTNQVNAEVTLKLPVEVANLTKQGELLDSQINVQEKQALSIVAETSKVTYQVENTLPEEVKVIQFNQDQIVAQTTKVAVDTVVASKQGNLVDAQICEVKSQTNQINANISLKLPEEVELIKRNQASVTAQTAQVDYTTATVLPAQVLHTQAQTGTVEAQTSEVAYRTTNVLPAQVDEITAQIAEISYRTASLLPSQVTNTTAQTAQVTAQTAQVTYTTTNLLPKQVDQLTAQVAGTTAQTAQVVYTTTNLLPAQVTNTTAQTASTNAQTDLYEQKKVTELAQTTTTAAAGSVMGVQNALMEQQTENYLRDAEQKAAKIMIETWAVRQNTDGGQAVTTNHLGDTYIATAVDALLAGI
jgi:hypothetical protein